MLLNFPNFLILSGIILLIVLSAVFLVVVARKKNDVSNFIENIYKTQNELAGRLSQLSENNASQQTILTTAIHEQKMSMLKMLDERLLEVTKNVGHIN